MTVVELSEDHLTRGCLQHAGNGDVDGPRDLTFGVVDHDHRSIVKVADALVVFLPLFEDEDPHRLSREHDRLQCVRQLIDV